MTTKISNPVDVFHYSPDLVINEHNWANFFSYLICFDLTDIPAPPLLSCGPDGYIGQTTPLSVFERFQNLLKLTPEAHKKAVKESLERWGQNISKLTHSLLRSSQTFFYRKSLVLERVVESKILMQFPNRPKLSEERINDIIKRIGTNGWIFDSLPGISGLAGFKDDQSVAGLCKRLESLPALSLWTEPFDLNYDILSRLLQQTKSALVADLDSLSEEERDSPKLTPAVGNKFRTIMLLALQSGDFKRMMRATDLLLEIQEIEPFLAEQLRHFLSFHLDDFLQTLFKLAQQCPSYHFIQHGSRIGEFRLAKNTAIDGLLNLTPALTTDSSFLYLFLAEGSHSIIYKIGTGEKGTVPGQFYKVAYDSFHSSSNVNPFIRWCHCDGNLLIRRAGDSAGMIHVMNANSLKVGRRFKLHMSIFKEYEQSPYFNTLFPVLTDSKKQLYAIVFFIKRVNLKIRPERREEYRKLVDMQQKEMEEQRKKEAELQAKKAEEKAKEEKDKLKSKKRAPAKAPPKEKKEDIGTSQSGVLDPTAFILEFRVYRYDISNLNDLLRKEKTNDAFVFQDPTSYQEAQELKEAFNGFFSQAECAHALNISERRDMRLAAKWLIDHGVQQRNCPTLIPQDYTTIAEVELDGKKLSNQILSGDASSLLKVALASKESAPPSNYQFYSYGYKQAKQPSYYGYGDAWNKGSSKSSDSGRDLKSSMANMMKEFAIKDKFDEVTGEKLQPILKPQDLLLGSWSIENDQLTVHLCSQETWEAKIFKLKQAKEDNLDMLELPLFMKSKSTQVRIHKPKQVYSRKGVVEEFQIQFKKGDEALLNVQMQDPDKMLEMYLKQAQNQPKDSPDFHEKRKVMRQKVKEALMQKRLKQVQEGKVQKEESKSPKTTGSTFKQEMSQKSSTYLFQPLQLESTLLVRLQSETSHLQGSNTPVITFDAESKRYFSFCTTSPGNIGFVSVFQDLSNCASVVRDTLPQHLRLGREWDENGDDTLRSFVLELRKLLLHFEAIRYDLPWRWNTWSFNFHVAYNFYAQQLKTLEGDQPKEGARKSVQVGKKEGEASKQESKGKQLKDARGRLSRLIVRLEKMLMKEEDDLRQQIKQFPTDLSTVQSTIAKYKEVLHQKKPDPKQQKNPRPKEIIVEPQQQIIVKNNLRKVQPFCIEGDIGTLDLLMEQLRKYGVRMQDPFFQTEEEIKESSPHDRDFYLMTLNFLKIWARESDIFLRNYKLPTSAQQLFKFLLTKIKNNRDGPQAMKMYWLILINGWDTIVSTLEEKGEILELLLQIRDEPIQRQEKESWIFEDMMSPHYHSTMLQIFQRICHNKYHFFYERSPFSPSIAQFKALLMQETKDPKKEKVAKKTEETKNKKKPSLMNASKIHLINLENSPAKNAQKHAYFPPSPYNSYLLLSDPKPIENGHLRRHNLAQIFRLYSHPDHDLDSDNETQLQAYLLKLRNEQNQRANCLWDLFQRQILKSLEECIENKPQAGERTYELWSLFSRLLEEAFGCSDWIEPSGYQMLSRMISLFNIFFKALKTALNLEGISDHAQYGSVLEKCFYRSPLLLPIWIRMFLQCMEHMSAFLLLTFPTNEDFFVALSIVEPLNNLLRNTKELMIGILRVIRTHKLSKLLLLDSSEGIDFSQNKVFETPHPYQRGEPPITESFVFPSAIAIQVEIDFRSRTQNQNDFLQIHSSAELNSVGKSINPNLLIQAAGGPTPISFTSTPQNYFHEHLGHGFRLKGKPSLKHPLIFLGNKVTFEFQADPNDALTKKNMMGLPGSMFAAPGSLAGVDSGAIPTSGSLAGSKAQVKKEELIRKWGFRCVCRPIYTEDLNLMIQNDLVSIPHSLQIEPKEFENFKIMSYCKPGQLSIQTILKTVQLMSYVSSQMSKILLRGDYLAKKGTKCKKILQWHLFKGGLANSRTPSELKDQFYQKLKEIDEKNETLAQLREKGTPAVLNTFEEESESDEESKSEKDKVEQNKESSGSEGEVKEEIKKETNQKAEKINIGKAAPKPLSEEISSLKDNFKIHVSKHLSMNLYKWVLMALSELQGKSENGSKSIPESIVAMIREEQTYLMTYTTELMRPKFKEELRRLWRVTEQIIVMAMLHHGDLLEEAEQFCGERNSGALLRGLGATAATHQREFKEQLKIIGKVVNGVFKDMLRQVHAQREFKQLLFDILEQAKQVIEEERAKSYEKKKKQEIQKREEQEQKQKQGLDKRGIPSRFKVTKAPAVPIRKKKNVTRNFAKTGHHQSKKQTSSGLVRRPSQNSEISQGNKQKKEEELEQEKSEEWKRMSVKEINTMKRLILEKVYDNYLSVYQGNAERCHLICLATGIQFNSQEPAESLKEVFKAIQVTLKPVLSFKEKELKKVKKSPGEEKKKPKIPHKQQAKGKEEKKAPQHDEDEAKREEQQEWAEVDRYSRSYDCKNAPERMDQIEKLKLIDMYQNPALEVLGKALFLLEIRASVDYQKQLVLETDKVLKRDSVKQEQKRKSVAQIAEQSKEEEDSDQDLEMLPMARTTTAGAAAPSTIQLSSFKAKKEIGGMEVQDEDEEDDLMPIPMSRSLSVQVQGAQATSNTMRLSKWVESNKLWRVWRKVNSKRKTAIDPLSPMTSPIEAVGLFLKTASASGEDIRKEIEIQQQKAVLREKGLTTAKQLLEIAIVDNSLLPHISRFALGTISDSITTEVFSGIEACGANLALQINSSANRLLYLSVASVCEKGFAFISKFSHIERKYKDMLEHLVSQDRADKSKLKSDELAGHTQRLLKQNMKELLLGLVDIELLLSNELTRQYLHVLIQNNFQQGGLQTAKSEKSGFLQNTRGMDLLRILPRFFECLVMLHVYLEKAKTLLNFSTSISDLVHHIENGSKIILYKLIEPVQSVSLVQVPLGTTVAEKTEKKTEKVQAELILQEMLLDKVVETLRKAAYFPDQSKPAHSNKPSNLLKPSRQQRLMNVLNLLYEILITINHTGLALLMMKRKSGGNLKELATVLSYIMFHGHSPTVLKSSGLSLEILLKHIDPSSLSMFQTIDLNLGSQAGQNEFLRLAAKRVGQWISLCPSANGKYLNLSSNNGNGDAAAHNYLVYIQMNSTKDEDFTYILNSLWEWEARHPSFTAKYPDSVEQLIEEYKETMASKSSPLKSIKIPPLRNFKRNQSVAKRSQDQENQTAKLLKQLSSYKLAVSQEVSNVEKYFEEFVNLTWEDFRFNKEKLGLEEQKVPKESPKKPETKVSHSDSEKTEKKTESIPDSPKVLRAKLNEQNFNIRVAQHLSDAQRVISAIQHRGYSAFSLEPMKYERALELVSLLQQAIEGKLPKIPINKYSKIKDEKTKEEKKLSNGKPVSSLFPLSLTPSEQNPAKPSPVVSQKVDLAKQRVILSMWSESVAKTVEVDVDSATSRQQYHQLRASVSLKTQDAYLGETFNPKKEISGSRTGVSRTADINAIIETIRSVMMPSSFDQNEELEDNESEHLSEQYGHTLSAHSSKLANRSSLQGESVYNQKNAAFASQRMKMLNTQWIKQFQAQINHALTLISQKWRSVPEAQQLEALGTIIIASGWLKSPRPGRSIKVNEKALQDQQQGSEGKKDESGAAPSNSMTLLSSQIDRSGLRTSTVLSIGETERDKPPTLAQIQKDIAVSSLSAVDDRKNLLREIKIDGVKLAEALLNGFKLAEKQWKSKLSLAPIDYDYGFQPFVINKDNIIALQEDGTAKNLKVIEESNSLFFNGDLLLSALLSLAAKTEILSTDSRLPPTLKEQVFLKLEALEQAEVVQNEYTSLSEQWVNEQALVSWEQLHDKVSPYLLNFFIPSQLNRAAPSILKRDNKVRAASAEELYKQHYKSKSGQENYILPESGYERQLPQPAEGTDKTMSALRLLNHWERFIIPKIVEYVKSSFRPWEMEYYFEQLRAPLRQGDQAEALKGAMIICEKKMPAGCQLMPESYDWGANSPEECVPGNWVIAKLPYELPKDLEDSQQFKHQHPILDRWAKRGVSQVAVLIRAFHFKTNEALVEIFDHQGMRSFLEWMPVSRLSHPQIQIPKVASSFSFNIIYAQAIKSLRSVQILSTRALLLQLGAHRSEENNTMKHIQRVVLQELGSTLVTGWIDDISDMLVIERKVEDKAKGNKKRTNKGLRDWMRDNIQSLLSKHNQTAIHEANNQEDTLDCLAASLENDCSPTLKDGEWEAPRNIDKVLNLQKWLCQEVWLTLASSFKHSNSNLVAAFEDYQKIKSRSKVATIETAYQQTWPITHQERFLLPLHQLVPLLLVGEGPKVEIPVGLILTFEEQAYLSRNSKLRFYADPAGLHLIKEIHALRNDISLEPIVFSTGMVWCLFEPGSTMLLPLHEQESAKKSSLQCRITSIPSNWPVAGWLTEKLSTAILSAALSPIALELEQKGIQVPSPNKMSKHSTPFITLTAGKKLLGGLIGSLAQFYSASQAPSPIRQVIFKLLNRLIRKRRFLAMHCPNPPPTTSVEKLKSFHFNELSLDPNWLTKLLQETHKFFKAKATIVGTLLSSYIQEAIELIASALMPLSMPKHQMILTPRQLLPSDSGELYDWMESVVTVGMFLHYFQGQGSGLPPDFAEQVFQSLQLNPSFEWSKALLIQNLPLNWSADKVKEQIWERVERHKARVIDKPRSLYIPCQGESHVGVAVVLLDGWQPQYLREDEEQQEEEKKEEPKPEAASPAVDPSSLPWYCSACTMENQSSNTHCNVCGSEKGSSSHLLPGSEEEKKAEGGSEISSPGKGAPDIRFSEIELIEAEISNQTGKRMKRLIKDIEEIWKGEKPRKEENQESKKDLKKEGVEQNEQVDQGESLVALFQEDQEGSGGSEEEKKKEGNEGEKKAEKKEIKKEEVKKEEGKKDEKKKQPPPKPPVKVWQYSTVKDSVNFKHFASFFQNRLFPTILEDLSFSKRATQVFHQIYENHFSSQGQIILPKDNQILEALDIYTDLAPSTKKETVMQEEEFMQKLLQIGTADPLALWDILLRHGYDFYLNRGGYSLVGQLPRRPTLSIQGLSSLRDLCENILCAETKAIYGFTPDCLRLLSKTINYLQPQEAVPSEMEYSESINAFNDQHLLVSNRELGEATQLDLRFNLALLREFNKHFAVAINFINPGTLKNTLAGVASSSKFVIPMTLTSFLASCRSLCFTNIKVEMQQTIIDKTANNYEKGPRLEFERLKLAHSIEKQQEAGALSEKQKGSSDQLPPALFLQAFDQIRSLDLSLFRPKRVKGTRPIAFDIVFKGEHVQGEGGPYRQFFADISAELQEQNANREGDEETQTAQKYTLDLLLPSPNNRANIGDFKHKWVLNPRKFDSLPHYEFLGILMGACIRTGVHLTLDLPSLVWRTIVGESPTLADLQEIDLGFTNKLEFLFSASKEQFEEQIFQSASINLSDDSTLVLKVGSGSTVTYNERFEFIEKAIIARLDESSRQIAAIRSGISKLVPLSLLSLSTGAELQKLVCGKRTVDLQLLERHTVYAGGLSKDSRRVKFFWQTIRQISEADQLKFIKFCWGQERLPANDDEFERLHTRFMIKPQGGAAAQKNPDQSLPKADTCFFNLELSDYSKKEVLKERLLLAINTDCDSMNAEVMHNEQGRQDDY